MNTYNYIPEDITHDDDELSTKPIRQKRLEIKKMMVSEDITHDDDQLSTETTQDHGNKKILRKKREFFRRQRVLYFIFDRWCVIIKVSFRIQSGVLCFWGF